MLLRVTMKPVTARSLIVAIVLVAVIVGTTVVNSKFRGDLIMGMLIIVLPFLVLSFSLPYLLPVRCPRCKGRMRFHFRSSIQIDDDEEPPRFVYVCEWCRHHYEWEGASSSSSFD